MLFFICLAILAGGLIWYTLDEWNSDFAGLVIFIGSILTLGAVIAVAVGFIGIDAKVAEYKAGYQVLDYQIKNNFYDNDNEIGKLQLMQRVEYWNRDLSYRQNIQDDFWIGIFIPNVYDQFEYIDYSNMK